MYSHAETFLTIVFENKNKRSGSTHRAVLAAAGFTGQMCLERSTMGVWVSDTYSVHFEVHDLGKDVGVWG